MSLPVSDRAACRLLRNLVEIPSVSGDELAASRWLTAQMRDLGYDHAEVDSANNAVGRMGRADAPRTVMLLGHIDTVPGHIPVGLKVVGGKQVLYGRGTVDAKGPLATFTVAAANLKQALPEDCQVVVVGAVEEEAATSKGARCIRDRHNGLILPIPDYCLVGEPTGTTGIARGYKGRILLRFQAWQPTAHTAGPGTEIAELAVAFWLYVKHLVEAGGQPESQVFEATSPSLREINTELWRNGQNHVSTLIGIRLPVGFDALHFVQNLRRWCEEQIGPVRKPMPTRIDADIPIEFSCAGPIVEAQLDLSGFEPAWLTPRRNHLTTCLRGAIRRVTGEPPRFLVKTGTCDMNVVGPAWGCPMFAYGPGDSELDHTPEEHIEIEGYLDAVRVLTDALGTLVRMS